MRVDPDHFWTISLSWVERRKPYPADIAPGADPERAIELIFGTVLRFDSEEAAWHHKRKYESELFWAPQHAIDVDVSAPTKTRRAKPLEMGSPQHAIAGLR